MSERISSERVYLNVDDILMLGLVSTMVDYMYRKSAVSAEGIDLNFVKILKARVDELYNKVI